MPNDIALHPNDRETGRADDLVQPFQIDRYGLRGRLVRLGDSVDAVLDRHDYPPQVSDLLGRAMALAACLASSVKYEGIFTLQASGSGPVRTLVADVTSEGAMRGYVGFDRESLDEALSEAEPTVPRLFGGGHLSFTVDQGGERQRYQGIVELQGATLAECVHHYFRQSEQIDTAIHLACGKVEEGSGGRAPWRASALMVQRLPEQRGEDQPELDIEGDLRGDVGGGSEEGWRRAVTFMGTATSGELLDPRLTPNSLLFRLFHEDGVRVFEPRPLEERCRCSRGRIERVLRSLPREEVEDLKIEDAVVVTCEFCNRAENFTESDLDTVYGGGRPAH